MPRAKPRMAEQRPPQNSPPKKRRRKKQVLSFCGAVIPGNVAETGLLELSWGGVSVSIPAENLASLDPRYQYACVEWVVQAEKQETLLYEVKRVEGEQLDQGVEKLLKEHCITMDREGSRWLCTKSFFDKLYEKAREFLG